MNNFEYVKVTSVQEAVTNKSSKENNHFIAGGTNILDLMKYQVTKAETLIDVNGIDTFKGIEELPNGGVKMSAFMTNADAAYHPIIEERYHLLSKAILAGASAQIRNMATNGGNLLQRTRCYYFYDANAPCNKRVPGSGCGAMKGFNRIHAILGFSDQCIAVHPSDMCIALAALDAIVHVSGPNGDRSIPFSDFHRLPGDTPHLDNNLQQGELIHAIELPANNFHKNSSYLKLRDRNSYAFALVSVATAVELEDGKIKNCRIALGAVAHKPWRMVEAEEYLIEKNAERQHFAAAAEIILRGASGFKHNEFKIELAKRGIVRNCLMALHPETALPGALPSR